MKKGLVIIIFAATAIIVIIYGDFSKKPGDEVSRSCTEPITYTIGSINSIYDLNEAELEKILQQIAESWSTAIGKNLFEFRKDGTVSINLIYDKQQQFRNKEQSASSRIKYEKISYQTAEAELQRLKTQYENKKQKYEDLFSRYNRLDITDQERTKGELKKSISVTRNEVNNLVDRVNEKASTVNDIAKKIDEMVDDYNKSYGEAREFNQGNYLKSIDGEMINIYSYSNLEELRLVLAHEMGHALGLQHVQNSKSVMYYLMQDQQTDSLVFTQEDLNALNYMCSSRKL